MVFKQFFDDIADQTNLYLVQCTGKSINVDENEIEQYFGILLLMSIIKLPQVRMYWSEGTRIPGIVDMMSISRFKKIWQYFHCNNNSVYLSKSDQNYDKLFKVLPVIDSVLDKSKSVPQEEMQLIDEQIIPTKSCCGIKQYMPKQPNKWSIKVWAFFGIVYDFEIYTGKAPNTQDKIPGIMMVGNVVHRLTKNFHFIRISNFDNFFSSVTLMKFLKEKGILAVATLWKDQMKGCQNNLLSEKELKKRGHGPNDYAVEANSSTILVRWYENCNSSIIIVRRYDNCIQLISNYLINEAG